MFLRREGTGEPIALGKCFHGQNYNEDAVETIGPLGNGVEHETLVWQNIPAAWEANES